jgi:hypothetical protein
MSKELPSYELLIEVFRRTLELTKKASVNSLKIIEKELEDNSENLKVGK